MSKKKIIKFLSKRVSKSSVKLSKFKVVRKGKVKEFGIEAFSKKRPSMIMGSISATSHKKRVQVIDILVNKSKRKKGLGTELLRKIFNSKAALGRKASGNIVSKQQLSNRMKFQGSFKLIKNHGKVNTIIPNKGFKKSFNKTTKKVRFIRRNGRIIPIKIKK